MFILPYSTDNPTRRIPIVVLTLMAANIVIFVWGEAQGFEVAHQFKLALAYNPQDFWIASLFTSMFAHADPVHIAMNMLMLWLFGRNVEDLMGRAPFLAFYLISGLAAVGLHRLVSGPENYFFLGASGAIAGTMGAYFILCPRVKVRMLALIIVVPFFFTVHALWALGYFFVSQLIYAIALTHRSSTAFWAHVGGFGFGAGLIFAGIKSGVLIVRNYDQVKKGDWARLDPADILEQELELASIKNSPGKIVEIYANAVFERPALILKPEKQIKLCRLLAESGSQTTALQALDRYLSRYPDGPDAAEAAYLSGRLLMSADGREAEAARRFALAIRIGGDGPWPMRARMKIQSLNEKLRRQGK